MTVEVTSRDTLEKAYIQGELAEVVNAMNMAKAKGGQFVICEQEPDGEPIALEMQNITQMRQRSSEYDAFPA